jgi:hypothetical protein
MSGHGRWQTGCTTAESACRRLIVRASEGEALRSLAPRRLSRTFGTDRGQRWQYSMKYSNNSWLKNSGRPAVQVL